MAPVLCFFDCVFWLSCDQSIFLRIGCLIGSHKLVIPEDIEGEEVIDCMK